MYKALSIVKLMFFENTSHLVQEKIQKQPYSYCRLANKLYNINKKFDLDIFCLL